MASHPTAHDMSAPIVPFAPRSPRGRQIPPLEAGDHLDQRTFHERYAVMPPNFRAELIDGMVIVPSPVRIPHGETHTAFQALLYGYKVATPGTNALDNTTAILGEESEPQPDSSLYIRMEYGGRCSNVDDYLVGVPELLAEISSSSEAYDLHGKFRDYERLGVLEYVVVLLRERRVRWFIRKDQRFEIQEPDEAGVFRSRAFPGLWVNSEALFQDDGVALMSTLQEGLRSPEHAAFVKELQSRQPR